VAWLRNSDFLNSVVKCTKTKASIIRLDTVQKGLVGYKNSYVFKNQLVCVVYDKQQAEGARGDFRPA
jgi:hypothetical protein